MARRLRWILWNDYVEKIRYQSVEELLNQIYTDIDQTREIIASVNQIPKFKHTV